MTRRALLVGLKDKGWFTDALNFAATAAKIVVPLVLA